MAEAAAKAAYESLEEFLDKLPKTPCEATPINRYYCTVCERLNRGVAEQCNNSSLTPDMESTKDMGGVENVTQFQPAMGETQSLLSPDTDTLTSEDKGENKVEFKVVAPMKSDDDYPLIELVQPKNKKIEPIEMELLEDVAIEFEVSDNEPIEVEPLEVEPLDDDYDDEELDKDIDKANIVEVEIINDGLQNEKLSTNTQPAPVGGLAEFKPINESAQPQSGPTPKMDDAGDQGLQPKKKIKKKHKKKPIKKSTIQMDSVPTIAQQPSIATTSHTQQVSPQVAARPTIGQPKPSTPQFQSQSQPSSSTSRRPTRAGSVPPAKLQPLREPGEPIKRHSKKPSKKSVVAKHNVPPRRAPKSRQPTTKHTQPEGLVDTAPIRDMGSAQSAPPSSIPTIDNRSGRKIPKRKVSKVKKVSKR